MTMLLLEVQEAARWEKKRQEEEAKITDLLNARLRASISTRSAAEQEAMLKARQQDQEQQQYARDQI